MGMEVGSLSAYLGFDDKDFESGVKSAKNSMMDIKKAADTATANIEKDFQGVSKELKKMFSDADTDKLAKELKQGGDAAKDAARKIETALGGIEDDTERVRRGIALFGDEWKDAGRKAERSLDGIEDKLKSVEKEAGGLDLGALGGAATLGGGLALADNKAAAKGHLQAMLGMSKAEAEEINKIASDVWKSGSGTDRRDAAEGVAAVYQGLGSRGSKLEKNANTAFALRDVYGADIPELVNAIAPMKINFEMSDQGAFDTITKGMQMGLNRSGDFIDTLNEYPAAFTRVGFGSDRMLASLEGGFKAGLKDTDKLADSINEFGLTMMETDGKIAKAFVEEGIFSPGEMERLQKDFAHGGEVGEAAFDKVLTAIMKQEDPIKRNYLGVQAFGTMWEDTSGLIGTALMETKDKSVDVEGATEALGAEYDNFKSKAEALGRVLQDSVIGTFADVAGGALPVIEAVGNIGMAVLAAKGLGIDFSGVFKNIAKRILPEIGPAAAIAEGSIGSLGLVALTATGYFLALGAAIYGAIEWAKKWAPVLAESRAAMDPNSTIADQYTGALSTEANADVGNLQRRQWGYDVPEDAPAKPKWDMSWIESKIYGRKAEGGSVGKTGPYLVGEKGIEVVNLRAGDHVTPNKNLGSASTLNVTGTVLVRGVNNAGELVGVAQIVAEDISRNDRRLTNRISMMPF